MKEHGDGEKGKTAPKAESSIGALDFFQKFWRKRELSQKREIVAGAQVKKEGKEVGSHKMAQRVFLGWGLMR